MGTIKIPAAEVLKKIYGETEESSARYTNLAVNFEKKYHHDKAEFFTAPGRTVNIIMTRQSFLLLRAVRRSLATMLIITAVRSLRQVSIWIPSVLLIQTEPM